MISGAQLKVKLTHFGENEVGENTLAPDVLERLAILLCVTSSGVV